MVSRWFACKNKPNGDAVCDGVNDFWCMQLSAGRYDQRKEQKSVENRGSSLEM